MLPVAADEIVSDSEDDDASRYQWESQYHQAVSLSYLHVYLLHISLQKLLDHPDVEYK
jgi:hypothetical protein